jgi:hypothetical protein
MGNGKKATANQVSPLRPLASETTGQSKILGLDRNTFSVNGSQVGILEQGHEVGLSSLLERHHSRGLEAQVSLEVLCDLTDETLEGKFTDEELRRFLIPTNLAQRDGTRTEPVWLLNATSCSGGGSLASSFGCELLTGGFASSGLASGLLGASHVFL